MNSKLLGANLKAVRQFTYGDDVEQLAERVGVPRRTWENYEVGVNMPATVLLKFLQVTGARPDFLATGEGGMFLDVKV